MLAPTAIAAIALFRNLNAEARRVLGEQGSLQRFSAGDMLWNAGDTPRGLHLLLDGEVRVVRIVGGRQHVVHTEGPGGTLGEVALFDGMPYPATAVAAQPSVCAVFSRAALEAAIERDASLAFVLLGRLAARLRHVIDRLDGASARTVHQRLARYLLGRCGDDARTSFALGGTQTEIAEELGTVREVLVRELRDLRDAQVIAPAGRGRFRVLSPARLRQRAGTRS